MAVNISASGGGAAAGVIHGNVTAAGPAQPAGGCPLCDAGCCENHRVFLYDIVGGELASRVFEVEETLLAAGADVHDMRRSIAADRRSVSFPVVFPGTGAFCSVPVSTVVTVAL